MKRQVMANIESRLLEFSTRFDCRDVALLAHKFGIGDSSVRRLLKRAGITTKRTEITKTFEALRERAREARRA